MVFFSTVLHVFLDVTFPLAALVPFSGFIPTMRLKNKSKRFSGNNALKLYDLQIILIKKT